MLEPGTDLVWNLGRGREWSRLATRTTTEDTRAGNLVGEVFFAHFSSPYDVVAVEDKSYEDEGRGTSF